MASVASDAKQPIMGVIEVKLIEQVDLDDVSIEFDDDECTLKHTIQSVVSHGL
jgi:hypothetical protein